ncbi:hypothetical protein [Dermatobacter hominis]|uniref:hypothetical protein n=1 Tax=Dermatobacter hominis TaxID=2884263 RepID=UPI001D0F9BB3|nr:hypothetical protein [Dermatobacter hominis]UDY35690.1 hypothetical protein LH044_20485 [Dermatobacter hominis]
MPTRSTLHPQQDVRRVLRALDAAGLGDAIPDVRTTLDRAEHLARSASQAPREIADVSHELARQLAAGAITPDEAGAAVLDAERAHAAHGAGVKLLRAAGDIAARKASDLLAAEAETLIADTLWPAGVKVIEAAVDAGDQLPDDVHSAEDAMNGDPVTRRAWAQLHDAATAWKLLTAAAWELHNGGFTRLSPRAAAAAETNAGRRLFEYRNPDQVLSHVGLPEPLVLLNDIRSGAEPEIQTLEQLRATEAEVDRRVAEERDALAFAARPNVSTPNSERAKAAARELKAELAAEAALVPEPEDAA